ncbi:MAG: TAXI family TRAP transporter solute-binding subunit [Thermodesulfobacteriota bacterium]
MAIQRLAILIAVLLLGSLAAIRPAAAEPRKVVISGGPAGGTFQVMAAAIQDCKFPGKQSTLAVQATPSAGSLENLRNIEAGKADFGVVYAGHLYMARNGLLNDDPGRYEQVMAVASLYGAPAQLIVRQGNGIRRVEDLAGKRVGVGMPGSGSFANCEQFFRHLGVWDRIERVQMGYMDTATAFAEGRLDALWLFTGFPSSAAMVAAQRGDMDLLDLNTEAKESGFYAKYPYFSQISVPSRTYRNVNHPTPTFQDSTLLVASASLPDEVVYELLATIFSKAGLNRLRGEKETFREMRVANGTRGIVTPMHPGAIKFWQRMGVRRGSGL